MVGLLMLLFVALHLVQLLYKQYYDCGRTKTGVKLYIRVKLYICILRYNQDCITSEIRPLVPMGNTVYGYATYVFFVCM
jgi:hypothetical protein